MKTLGLKNITLIGLGLYLLLVLVAIYVEFFWVLLIPLVIFVIYTFFKNHQVFYYIIFLLTPVSIGLEKFTDFNVGLYFPTEPMIVLSLIVLFFKFFYEKNYPLQYIKHPLSVLILLHLAWMFITSFTSSMVIVSVKYFLVRFWYVMGFYFFGLILLQKNPIKTMQTILWCYFVTMFGVILYTITRHALLGFNEKAAHWVMQPFFKDHTSYGAIIAMLTPFVFLVTFKKRKNMNHYVFIFMVFLLFMVGLVLSYTRAAWISLIGALVLYVILVLKINWRYLFLGVLVASFIVAFNWTHIMMRLEKNKQDSSADIVEHVKSISNIASDASNLERINRWSSAYKMFLEKPIFGWGPGTYMFKYAPFQSSTNLTIISTNFADGGNAHSEYLGPLAESGVLGIIFITCIMFGALLYGVKVYQNSQSVEEKKLILVILLGFLTYVLHGFLNNYLDTDKASVLFWIFISGIVIVDIQQKSNKLTGK